MSEENSPKLTQRINKMAPKRGLKKDGDVSKVVNGISDVIQQPIINGINGRGAKEEEKAEEVTHTEKKEKKGKVNKRGGVLKDRFGGSSEILKRELSELKIYERSKPEGRRLSDKLSSFSWFGHSFNMSPLAVPLQRRLQTLVVAWHAGSFLYFLIISLFMLANPFLWWFILPYMVYYMFDRSPANGKVVNRYSLWFRSLKIWDYYAAYYPIKLHKTVDLEPTFTVPSQTEKKDSIWKFRSIKNSLFGPFRKKNATGPRYIFGYHPHGVGALGAFGALATEGCHWNKLFPGIPVCVCTLVNQFQIPIYRDYLLALGCTSVSRKNVLKVLENNFSIGIVIGGARESLLSKVGSTDLVLEKRKGFVKLALETGNVNLVPIYCFGETDCFNILDAGKDTYLRRFQLWVMDTYGFTIPFFFARGMFNYDFGFLPFRNPMDVVVGRPIYIEKKISNPSMDQINHYHSLYVAELERVFEENKDKYGYQNSSLKLQ